MVKITYPSGKTCNFAWITKKYGYFKRHGKIYRYPLPEEKTKKNGGVVLAPDISSQSGNTKAEPITDR